MKTNLSIETAPISLIAEYLGYLYSITEKYAANDYSSLWCNLWDKIMSDDICDAIMRRFDNFNWEPKNDYNSYKDECEDFIAAFIDFAASENEDLLPSFDDYVKSHN